MERVAAVTVLALKELFEWAFEEFQQSEKVKESNTKTLARETDWRKRVIKESILTNRTLGNAINDTKHVIRVVG